MSQKLHVNTFQWNKDTSQFNEDFNYNKESDEEYFLKVDVLYLKFHNHLRFLPESMNIENVEKLAANLDD